MILPDGLCKYSLLGVSPSCSEADIRTAYRRRALETHPDKGGSGAAFRAVIEAYEVLSNATLRVQYDRRREDPVCMAASKMPHQHPCKKPKEAQPAAKKPPKQPKRATEVPPPPSKEKRAHSTQEVPAAAAKEEAAAAKKKQRCSASDTKSQPDEQTGSEYIDALLERLLSFRTADLKKALDAVPSEALAAVMKGLEAMMARRTQSRGKQREEDAAAAAEEQQSDMEQKSVLLALCAATDSDMTPAMEAAAAAGHTTEPQTSESGSGATPGARKFSVRGIYSKHGHFYGVAVYINSVVIQSRQTLLLSHALDIHADLLQIKQLTQEKQAAGSSFPKSIRDALRHVIEARKLSRADPLQLSFSTNLGIKQSNHSSPVTHNIDLLITFWEHLQHLNSTVRDSSVRLQKWRKLWPWMKQQVREDRERRAGEAPLTPSVLLRALRSAKAQSKRHTVPTHLVQPRSLGPGQEGYFSATLRASDGSVLYGPPRPNVKAAADEHAELLKIRERLGEDALAQELLRREVEVMTQLFVHNLG
eukprot:TRINITY_DN43483_c0_g1_i1.p1 TRINITY_DN43483_c0_g1~~TRINITY_DN43483_c0_g1_i1.p1  ORF type:complete len:533 (+),score=104.23 TRINITY_DN43483_c0_g1_i1:85-1683(+)